jgi:hypothetical protein
MYLFTRRHDGIQHFAVAEFMCAKELSCSTPTEVWDDKDQNPNSGPEPAWMINGATRPIS